jgi:hypothetical protein
MGLGAWTRANRVWLNTTGGYLVSTAAYDAYGNRTSATAPTSTTTRPTTSSRPRPRDPLYIAGDTRHKTTAL